MASLLNLPFVSYFLPSSMTAWSTSLNLLFFYMTWTTLVLSQSPFKLEILGTLAIRLVFWLLPSLVFLLFDTFCPGISISLKYKGAVDLQDRNVRTHARLLGLGLFNLLTSTAVQALISLGVSTLFKTSIYRTTTTLPLPWQMAKHIAILYLLREVLTYYIHRFILHAQDASSKRSPSLSNRLTTLHLRYAHANNPPSTSSPSTSSWRKSSSLEPTQPTPLTLFTDHPLPSLLHRFVPLYLPPLLLSLSFHVSPLLVPYIPISAIPSSTHHLHLLTLHLFTILVTLEETLSLAGYTTLLTLVPIPGILLSGVAKRQGRHFGTQEGMKGKSGNFGAWGMIDLVLGTRLLKDETRGEGKVVVEREMRETKSGGGRKGRSSTKAAGGSTSAPTRKTRTSSRRTQREDLSKSLEDELKQVAEGLREAGEGFVDGIKELGEGMGVRRSGRIRERSSRAGSVMR